MGLQISDFPPIAKGFDVPLEENMTVALEPKFIFPDLGTAGIEDTYLITSRNSERLTKAPKTIEV